MGFEAVVENSASYGVLCVCVCGGGGGCGGALSD